MCKLREQTRYFHLHFTLFHKIVNYAYEKYRAHMTNTNYQIKMTLSIRYAQMVEEFALQTPFESFADFAHAA